MNKGQLKAYAPQARRDFIAAVTARAHLLGISAKEIAPNKRKGDIAIIAGREWPVKVADQRDRLISRIKQHGFTPTMEAVAYTWFNRLAALRFMEIHDYLGHGHRVLSSRTGGLPEALAHATEVDLPGLDKATARELKLAGNKDGELYKMLLVAQCNALANAMPFLFERIDDETELLLPDNLLRTDSVIAKLVEAIPEEDWQQVEIIGWLYQFYISEKKDQVIGKVVKSEDIPAATQLFTPNWIVQYLVQNSVGRLWLMANPSSTLKSQWPYYIEPAKQAPEVQAQLDALIQTRMAEDGGGLNPETITVFDPACGSGHILVEAYEVLKAIYLERGYQPRTIPRLILEKNLYGLEIDDRAAQLAGFALLMKARADDRRLLDNPPKLNVLSLQESKGLHLDDLAAQLKTFGIQRGPLKQLLDTFAHAKTFGSLIQIPQELNAELPTLAEGLQQAIQKGDLLAKAAAQELLPLAEQARVLGMQFDAVVANPPYMGIRKMPETIRAYLQKYKAIKHQDLYTMFIERFFSLSKESGFAAAVTLHGWMQYSSFEDVRRWFNERATIQHCAHLGSRVFEELSGEVVQVAAFVAVNKPIGSFIPRFVFLGGVAPDEKPLRLHDSSLFRERYTAEEYRKMPYSIYAFNMPRILFQRFKSEPRLGDKFSVRQGLATTNDERFLRLWFEIPYYKIAFGCGSPREGNAQGFDWFPFNKGGGYRKWYGNGEYVINYAHNGKTLLSLVRSKYPKISDPEFVIKNRDFYCQPGVTWSNVSGGAPAFRFQPKGVIFGSKGSCIFDTLSPQASNKRLNGVLAFVNSVVAQKALEVITAGVDLNVKQIESIPVIDNTVNLGSDFARQAIAIAKDDWDSFEVSWDFKKSPFATDLTRTKTLKVTWENWCSLCDSRRAGLKKIEEEINNAIIGAYNLQNELSPDVAEEHITLARADRNKDCQRLISYAIGCMMGRYSLDEPGLIYAHGGNVGFDSTRYKTFPADADGIVPLTDQLWFGDDAANRIREFLLAVWGVKTLNENMAWLAESLSQKGDETPEETMRRYLADKFFKDHLQTYKKRPIYWLFSSGKQGAFQALVYLHRYHEGTLSRMRSEYVIPLSGKIQSRIDMLEKDAEAASSTAARNKLNKEIEGLRKKHVELLAYDEKLRHYADMRIKLDLDDGVKVNYGKFGDLLAEVKAVSGDAGDE